MLFRSVGLVGLVEGVCGAGFVIISPFTEKFAVVGFGVAALISLTLNTLPVSILLTVYDNLKFVLKLLDPKTVGDKSVSKYNPIKKQF